jgi:peptide/nickel transport system ATP-binding protein
MAALLEARDVSKVFGAGVVSKKSTYALQNASITINDERPSITAIAGECGSGKTTVARLLLGIIEPTSGQVFYKGQDLQKINRGAWKVSRREVQGVFQDPFEVYTPFYKVDNVLTTPIAKFYPGTGKAEARAMIEQALNAVGLRPEETLGRYPHQLSGGQRQRVLVARADLAAAHHYRR